MVVEICYDKELSRQFRAGLKEFCKRLYCIVTPPPISPSLIEEESAESHRYESTCLMQRRHNLCPCSGNGLTVKQVKRVESHRFPFEDIETNESLCSVNARNDGDCALDEISELPG